MELVNKFIFALDGVDENYKIELANTYESIMRNCEEYNKNIQDKKQELQPYDAYIILSLARLIAIRNNRIVSNIFDIYLQIILQNNRDSNYYNRNNENKLLEELYTIIINSI